MAALPNRVSVQAQRREFMRKGVMAIAAALALGTATIATGVTAAPHGGGGGGGGAHFSGGGGGAPMAAGPRSGGTFNGGATFNGGSRFSGARTGGTFNGARTLNGARTFNGGNFAFHHHHRHFHGGVGLFAFGGPYYDDYGCWRLRRVWTPWGWHWRRIYVCY